jgi:CRISPR-associated protein Cas5d
MPVDAFVSTGRSEWIRVFSEEETVAYAPIAVKVWGEFACFTRPELKVERVTYAVPTPTAARGILEAIFWKPEANWNVREISILAPIAYFPILRNEVNTRASERSAQAWAKAGVGGFVASEDRAQRNTLALRDVAYIIKADIEVKPGCDAPEAKYRDQARRRIRRGQCFAQPYLGCREFTASFGEPESDDKPLDLTMDLGRMLLAMDYVGDVAGDAKPRFFHARLEKGILRVPQEEAD